MGHRASDTLDSSTPTSLSSGRSRATTIEPQPAPLRPATQQRRGSRIFPARTSTSGLRYAPTDRTAGLWCSAPVRVTGTVLRPPQRGNTNDHLVRVPRAAGVLHASSCPNSRTSATVTSVTGPVRYRRRCRYRWSSPVPPPYRFVPMLSSVNCPTVVGTLLPRRAVGRGVQLSRSISRRSPSSHATAADLVGRWHRAGASSRRGCIRPTIVPNVPVESAEASTAMVVSPVPLSAPISRGRVANNCTTVTVQHCTSLSYLR